MPPADPAPDSHEPAGRVDVPGAAPEWAVEEAQREYAAMCGATMDGRPAWDSITHFARLLATLRERTLREAAGVCLKIREAYIDTADKYIGGTHTVFGSKGAALGEGADAILSLIAQPPKEEA